MDKGQDLAAKRFKDVIFRIKKLATWLCVKSSISKYLLDVITGGKEKELLDFEKGSIRR